MDSCFHPSGLFYFYSTWALIAHIIFFTTQSIPTTFLLAWIVFIGGMLGNLRYISLYNLNGNLLRIPYELVMHILPLVLFYFTSLGRKHIVSWQSPIGWILPVILVIFYVTRFDIESIKKFYNDPIYYIFGSCASRFYSSSESKSKL